MVPLYTERTHLFVSVWHDYSENLIITCCLSVAAAAESPTPATIAIATRSVARAPVNAPPQTVTHGGVTVT